MIYQKIFSILPMMGGMVGSMGGSMVGNAIGTKISDVSFRRHAAQNDLQPGTVAYEQARMQYANKGRTFGGLAGRLAGIGASSALMSTMMSA